MSMASSPSDGTPLQVVPAPDAAGADPRAAAAGTDPASSPRGFLKRLDAAFHDLATLKVVTVVGSVSVTGTDAATTVTALDTASVEAASTQVGLLDGHIVNVFSPKFAEAGNGTFQAFHQSQVEKSNDIVMRNLAELQKLASVLLAMRR